MNHKHIFDIRIANIDFQIEPVNIRTVLFFRDFIHPEKSVSNKLVSVPSVTSEELVPETKRLKSEPFAEYSLLFEHVSNTVLPLGCFFYHGAAFRWNDKAFIFTGKSGIGKTTQLRNWLKLYGQEIEIINGDKPLIEHNEHNQFIVHPSPWTGKEGWNGEVSAGLAGIILLEQGTENHICRLEPENAVLPLFLQFLYKPETVDAVNQVCEYEEKLIRTIPVWNLVNTGDEESSRLTHDTLLSEVFR